jgi:AcrR family transcriptional regulator
MMRETSQQAADPRANQKERTRTAIVEAAAALVREGKIPTIAATAERAKVSRATAYRYFPTQDDLSDEVAPYHPAIAAIEEAVASLSGDDVEQRLLTVVDTYNESVVSYEAHMRTILRAFQENWLKSRRESNAPEDAPYMRSPARMRWLDEALRPLAGPPPDERTRLRAALALTLGIEAFVVMKDVCRLDDDEALATLRWAATALLRAGVDEERGSGSPNRGPEPEESSADPRDRGGDAP